MQNVKNEDPFVFFNKQVLVNCFQTPVLTIDCNLFLKAVKCYGL